MIDPDLKVQLDQLNQNLIEIKNKKGGGVWRAFFNGMFGAFGYLVGIVVVVVIVGWTLKVTGLLAPFQVQWQKFENFMTKAENVLGSEPQSQQGSGQNVNSQGQIYTLPDGEKVQVVQ